MKLFLSVAALAIGVAAPVLAQDVVIEFKPETFVCADYNALDDAGKASLLPAIRLTDPVSTTEALKNQDDAELTVTTTQACAENPDMKLVDALSQVK